MNIKEEIKIIFFKDKYLYDLTNLMNQWSKERQYTVDDIKQHFNLIKKQKDYQILIAVNHNKNVLGYALIEKRIILGFDPFVEIVQLLVDENYRSLGIGNKLLLEIEKFTNNIGINQIMLSSRMERDRAHKFYQKNGFKEFKQSKFFEKHV
jgi:ribosomal protein S18 acetylase RimI-like enzyme